MYAEGQYFQYEISYPELCGPSCCFGRPERSSVSMSFLFVSPNVMCLSVTGSEALGVPTAVWEGE